ncbi:hypothetical protein RI367_003762 [Sorochytrium milnesiophthora]
MAAASGRHNVRKRSWWDRASAYPGDMWLKIMEDYETFDWDRFHNALSWPVALGLNVLYLLCSIAASLDRSPSVGYPLPLSFANNLAATKSTSTIGTVPMAAGKGNVHVNVRKLALEDNIVPFDIDWQAWIPAGFYYWVWTVEALLCSISVGNALYLLTKTKRYYLFEADDDDPPRSSNARKVILNPTVPEWSHGFLGHLVWTFYQSITRAPANSRLVWQLSMWDPPIFALNLFCCFSPAQVMLLHRFQFSSFLSDLGLLILLPAMFIALAYKYRGLVNDKQIIFGQVYREYHTKLVNPRIFVRKETIAIGTDDFGTSTDDVGYASEEEDQVLDTPQEDYTMPYYRSTYSRTSAATTAREQQPQPPPSRPEPAYVNQRADPDPTPRGVRTSATGTSSSYISSAPAVEEEVSNPFQSGRRSSKGKRY